MCIALSRLKMDNEVLRDAILAVSEDQLNLDKIQKLIPIVPTNEEQQQLKDFKDDPNDLEMAEKFVYALRYIENISERLTFWDFKIQFDGLCSYEQNKIDILRDAHDTVDESKSFKLILQYILLVGNFMNTGNRKTGGVNGFQLALLLKLGDTKANDKKTSLLEFIVKQCYKKHPNALQFAHKFTEDLPPAMRLDLEQIKGNIDGINKTLKKLETMIKDEEIEKKENKKKKEEEDDDNDDDDDDNKHEQEPEDMFDAVMSEFLNESRSKFALLQSDFESIVEDLSDLGTYLGEKDDKELIYLETLNEFSENVQHEIDKIKKGEIEEARAKRKAEAEEKRKAAAEEKKRLKKLEQLRKAQASIHHKPRHHQKPRHPPPPRPQTSEQSLAAKIDNISKRDITTTKPKKQRKQVKAVKKYWNCPRCTFENYYLLPNCEMCNGKKPEIKKRTLKRQPTMTEKMLSLVSLDDLQQRRKLTRMNDKKGNMKKKQQQRSSKPSVPPQRVHRSRKDYVKQTQNVKSKVSHSSSRRSTHTSSSSSSSSSSSRSSHSKRYYGTNPRKSTVKSPQFKIDTKKKEATKSKSKKKGVFSLLSLNQ